MAPISVLDRSNLNGCSNHSKKTADQNGVIILSMSAKVGRLLILFIGRTEPRARRSHRTHNLKMVVMIVKEVKVHVRTSKIPPIDSSGGSGLGGTTAAIENLWRW